MPRIRTIKPEFWKSEDIAAFDKETRLTFVGLWSYVDDSGVGRDDARLIVAELYPLEPDQARELDAMHRALASLAARGLIARYVVGGKSYLSITGWKHQRIDRPAAARYPGPDDPAAEPLTCDDAPDRAVSARAREDASSPRDECTSVPGEQRIRGAGDQVTTSPSRREDALSGDFAAWYAAYPRHIGRDAAAKAYAKAVKRADPAELLSGAQRFAAWCRAADLQFVPYPATWLNAGQWADELGPPPTGRTDRIAEGDRVLRDAMAQAEVIDAQPTPTLRAIGSIA